MFILQLYTDPVYNNRGPVCVPNYTTECTYRYVCILDITNIAVVSVPKGHIIPKLGPHKDSLAVISVVTEAIIMDLACIPTAIVEGAAGAVGGATVQGAIHIIANIAKNFYRRYASLQPNERQRDEICSKVTEVQGILQRATETAADTRDDHTKQALWNIQQKFKRCLQICKEIEERSFRAKFQNAPDDVKRVQELSRLLDESISIATLHFTVSNYTTLPAIQQSLRHVNGLIQNPQGGIYELDSECQNEPEKVGKPTVIEEKPGVLYVGWNKILADNYELEYDRQNGKRLKVKSTECKLDSTQVCFPDNICYKIRVRGVNGRGPGKWSETTVGMFTVLPEQPHKPIAVYVNSATSITLVMKKPEGREGAKPVTDFVVEYHTENNRGMTRRIFPVDNLEMVQMNGMEAFKIDLNCDAASTYFVQISHRNKDGDSLPCEDTIRVDTIPPGEPVGLTVVHTTTRTIIIEWSEPETSRYIMVDHYEVKWGRNGHITETKTTKKCYTVFRNLETFKEYLFKVKAVNKMGYRSQSIEIRAETKSMTAKVGKVAGRGALAGAALTGLSLLTPVFLGAEHGIVGFAGGVLITPVYVVVFPFLGTALGIASRIEEDEKILEHYLKKYPDDSDNP